MTDRPAWVVMFANMYLCGLGASFEAQKVGYVVSGRKEDAKRFTSLESAKQIADRFGGQVFKE